MFPGGELQLADVAVQYGIGGGLVDDVDGELLGLFGFGLIDALR